MAQLFGLARLGRDAELRHTANGDPVAGLALAFTYGQKGQDGKRPTQWVEASIWGKRAESLTPYLLKGTSVSITVDEIHVETFNKSDGTTGVKLVGRVSNLDFAGAAAPAAAKPAPAPKPEPTRAPAANLADMDDDIPF